MPSTSNTTTLKEVDVPTLDLNKLRSNPTERAELVEALRACCHEGIGFFYLTGHGIPGDMFEQIFAMMRRVFHLPLDQKQIIDKARSPHFRGWESTGAEKTQGKPDHREQIDTWSECEVDPHAGQQGVPTYRRLLGPNQFFGDEIMPGYKALTLQWHERLSAVCSELLEVISLALQLPAGTLHQRFGANRQSLIKFIHYPPTPESGQGVGMHQDSTFLTLLVPDDVPGLQVQLPSGEVVPIGRREGAFIVNLGEAMQLMTGNYFVATPHRVITAGERYSTGFFYGPCLDADLSPLSLPAELLQAVERSHRHQSVGTMPTKEELDQGVHDSFAGVVRHKTYGDMLWQYFSRAYPELARLHYPENPKSCL